MILIHPCIDFPIQLYLDRPNVLVIEDSQTLNDTVYSIVDQLNSLDGDLRLYENEKELKFKGNVLFPESLHKLSFNERTIWSRITNILQELIIDEDHYEDYVSAKMRIFSLIEESIDESDLPISLKQDDFNLANLIKAMPIELENLQSESMLERLLDFMKIHACTTTPKLYIFLELKSFLSIEELETLYRTASYEKYRILLIESHQRKMIPLEKYTIIDEDRCVI